MQHERTFRDQCYSGSKGEVETGKGYNEKFREVSKDGRI